MRSLEEIKERSDTAHLMIAKFGADGEKTVCYQSMEDIPSLITTIESQNSQIESLKAITELAVPALKWYADKKNWNLGVSISMGSAFPLHEAIKSDKGKIATTALSEIERLKNE